MATDVFLGHAGLDEAHCGGVHQVAHLGSTLQLHDFLSSLDRAHLDDSHAQVMRTSLTLLVGMEAQQVHNLNLGVMTVRRQEMDAATLGLSLVTDDLQLLHGS